MSIFILGSTGQIGSELSKFFQNEKIIKIPQSLYKNWSKEETLPEILNFFKLNYVKQNSVIFISCGILNPKNSEADLMNSNFYIPRNIIQALEKIQPKIVTFGSVFERLNKDQNYYILSKYKLSEFVESQVSLGANLLHLRLHTIFGNQQPKSFMFLGQILDSIINNKIFEMTSGSQLREYHHVADEVRAISKIISAGSTGVFELNHGQSETLRKIAESVFENLGKTELLKIGSLPTSPKENFNYKFGRSEFIQDLDFREPIPAITEYIKFCTNNG